MGERLGGRTEPESEGELSVSDMAPANGSWSEDIAVRFGVTMVANVLRAGFSFASGLLIARGLGASAYGDLTFLLGSFAAISQLLEMGTSAAFYTFISKHQRGPKFFAFYLGWLVFQFASTALVVGLILPDEMVARIWIGHDQGIVLLALAASFFTTQAWRMVSQLGEATRKTVVVQAAAVTQSIAHLALAAAAIYLDWLTIQAVMLLLVGEYAVLVGFLGPKLLRENLLAEQSERGVREENIVRDFTVYCKPLIVYAWVGFLYAFADRWFLQAYGGAEQQGFFAVGQQFANVSLIATISILRVFWKEVAEAQARSDHQRVQFLYRAVSRGLYCTAAWISCLLIPYSQELLAWTAGASYTSGWLCLALMFFYPIHQSLGQIQGAFLYASGQTAIYARIGLVMMAVSIPATYFTLASSSAVVAGLGLGSVGLALKMVGLQIISVNVQAYLIARTYRLTHEFGYQGAVVAFLFIAGWACKWLAGSILGAADVGSSSIGVVLVGSSLYVAFSVLFLYQFPTLFGLTCDQVHEFLTAMRRRLAPATV